MEKIFLMILTLFSLFTFIRFHILHISREMHCENSKYILLKCETTNLFTTIDTVFTTIYLRLCLSEDIEVMSKRRQRNT